MQFESIKSKQLHQQLSLIKGAKPLLPGQD